MADRLPAAMVDGAINSYAVNFGIGAGQILWSYDARRVAVLVGQLGSGSMVMTSDPKATFATGPGVFFSTGFPQLHFSRALHGVLVRGPMYVSGNAGGLVVGIIEVLADSP